MKEKEWSKRPFLSVSQRQASLKCNGEKKKRPPIMYLLVYNPYIMCFKSDFFTLRTANLNSYTQCEQWKCIFIIRAIVVSLSFTHRDCCPTVKRLCFVCGYFCSFQLWMRLIFRKIWRCYCFFLFYIRAPPISECIMYTKILIFIKYFRFVHLLRQGKKQKEKIIHSFVSFCLVRVHVSWTYSLRAYLSIHFLPNMIRAHMNLLCKYAFFSLVRKFIVWVFSLCFIFVFLLKSFLLFH